ncbi:Ras- protein Rab-18 [Rhizophlyctis rosea]|nr:Ras- protein Rab-18 [Rhizophlyctis rosea]
MAETPASDRDVAATFKLLLIGDSGTGKSSLLLRFTDDTWLQPDEVSATIGVDFKVKVVDVDNKKYKLTIWDTAGQERFRTLTSSYYRGAQGVILVYDVSNKQTFEHLQTWFTELDTYSSSQDVIKMIVGNKCDKEASGVREVSRKEGEAYARKMGTLFIETSAKTKTGVRDAFVEVVRKKHRPYGGSSKVQLQDRSKLAQKTQKKAVTVDVNGRTHIKKAGTSFSHS